MELVTPNQDLKTVTIAGPHAVYSKGGIHVGHQGIDSTIRYKLFDVRGNLHFDYPLDVDYLPNDPHGTPAMVELYGWLVMVYGDHSGAGIQRVATCRVDKMRNPASWKTYTWPFESAVGWTYPYLVTQGGYVYVIVRNSYSAEYTKWEIYRSSNPRDKEWTLVGTLFDEGNGYSAYPDFNYDPSSDRLHVGWAVHHYSEALNIASLSYAYSARGNILSWFKGLTNTAQALPLSRTTCQLYAPTFRVGNCPMVMPAGREAWLTLAQYQTPYNRRWVRVRNGIATEFVHATNKPFLNRMGTLFDLGDRVYAMDPYVEGTDHVIQENCIAKKDGAITADIQTETLTTITTSGFTNHMIQNGGYGTKIRHDYPNSDLLHGRWYVMGPLVSKARLADSGRCGVPGCRRRPGSYNASGARYFCDRHSVAIEAGELEL